jgi:hypothetical protein
MKTKRRIYSDKFIERTIEKIDALNDKVQAFYPEAPDLSDKPWLQKQQNEFIKHRSDLSYIKGFWYGYTLASGIDFDKDYEKTEKS